MTHEIAIPFTRSLRGVTRSDLRGASQNGGSAPAEPSPEPTLADLEKSLQEDREMIRRALDALRQTAANLENRQQQYLGEMRQAVVELAVALASRILREKIRAEDFAVEAMVRETVAKWEPNQPVTVHLNPADLRLLERRLGSEEPTLPEDSQVRLFADATLERGQCRAESGDVTVLSQWQTQLEELRQHLLENM